MNTDDGSKSSAATQGSVAPERPSHLGTVALVVLAIAVPLAVILAIICALIPGVPWFIGLIVGLLVAAVAVAFRLARAVDLVLAQLGAVEATDDDHPRLHNIAQGLSLAGGVPQPELYVVDDQARNAAAVARGDRSAIVCTIGLLESLDRIGLEGIVAEALVRIRGGDAEASTVGSALFSGLLVGPTSSVFRPAAAAGLRRLLPDDRDLAADMAAVALTRYPPGLHTALNTIRSGTARTAASTAANEHVWLVPPSAVEATDQVMVTSAPLDLRIDVLAEL